MLTKAPSRERRILGVSPNVFYLGVVSFLTDISSEMTFTLLPLFLLNVLKVGTPVIGLIEGVAESTSTLLRILSGWLSDRMARRKPLAVLGYSISTLSKPFLYLATAWGATLGIRFADRFGKGIRTAPRDALVADSAPAGEMGRSFGLHRAMDTAGAVLGLGIAAIVVYWLQRNALELSRHTFQILVLAGIIPAVAGVLVLAVLVRERRSRKASQARESLSPAGEAAFGRRFKIYLGIIVVFTLGNFSDAFLILRAQGLGLSTFHILGLLVGFNLLYALTSLPAGLLSDRLGRKGVLLAGWAVHGLLYLGFAFAGARWQAALLLLCFGLYHGIADGVERALVADMAPLQRRGTAYGLYHGAVGLAALPASLMAGFLWQISPAAPFYLGAALTLVAMMGLLVLGCRTSRSL